MSEQRSADEGAGDRSARTSLPAATRLGSVRLQVADLERSVAYYEQVLGLVVRERGTRHAVFTAEGAAAPLVEVREDTATRPLGADARLGLYHFAILLPDRASLGRLARHLAGIGVQVAAADHLVSEALYLRDPDGLGIEVYADRPRDTWRYAGDELVMTTDRLDMVDLLSAAGTEPWAGMPPETSIGHVHLHVGDLAEASAFYEEALGLDRTVSNYPGALFLSAGGYHHHLGLNTWARGAAPAGEGDARLLEWEIMLPSSADVDAALRSLQSTGRPVENSGTGGVVRDPWGIALRLRSE